MRIIYICDIKLIPQVEIPHFCSQFLMVLSFLETVLTYRTYLEYSGVYELVTTHWIQLFVLSSMFWLCLYNVSMTTGTAHLHNFSAFKSHGNITAETKLEFRIL